MHACFAAVVRWPVAQACRGTRTREAKGRPCACSPFTGPHRGVTSPARPAPSAHPRFVSPICRSCSSTLVSMEASTRKAPSPGNQGSGACASDLPSELWREIWIRVQGDRKAMLCLNREIQEKLASCIDAVSVKLPLPDRLRGYPALPWLTGPLAPKARGRLRGGWLGGGFLLVGAPALAQHACRSDHLQCPQHPFVRAHLNTNLRSKCHPH